MPLNIDTNLSALQALGKKQAVTANNIANTTSTGFKKSRTALEETVNGSVTTRTQPVNTPGTQLLQADGSLDEQSNVDLGAETVGMISTKHAYQANLKALQTSTEMEDSILDLSG